MRDAKKIGGGGGWASVELGGGVGAIQVSGNLGPASIPGYLPSAPSVRSEEPLFPTYDVPRPVRLTSHYEVPPSPLPLHPSPATRQYKLQVTTHIQYGTSR